MAWRTTRARAGSRLFEAETAFRILIDVKLVHALAQGGLVVMPSRSMHRSTSSPVLRKHRRLPLRRTVSLRSELYQLARSPQQADQQPLPDDARRPGPAAAPPAPMAMDEVEPRSLRSVVERSAARPVAVVARWRAHQDRGKEEVVASPSADDLVDLMRLVSSNETGDARLIRAERAEAAEAP